ncbi:uncharacterized protein METZ01_LOCUS12338 [marine metagenome]|uniref:Uncharacterized protein n=1 Tax=marine metagenome TaxID=408172 RepID=A0A381NZ58_9ZZZZ
MEQIGQVKLQQVVLVAVFGQQVLPVHSLVIQIW